MALDRPTYRRCLSLCLLLEMLANIFEPLFAATLNPTAHPKIHYFLETIVSNTFSFNVVSGAGAHMYVWKVDNLLLLLLLLLLL